MWHFGKNNTLWNFFWNKRSKKNLWRALSPLLPMTIESSLRDLTASTSFSLASPQYSFVTTWTYYNQTSKLIGSKMYFYRRSRNIFIYLNNLFLPWTSVEHVKTCDVDLDTVVLHDLRFPKLIQRYESCNNTKLKQD